MILVFISLKNLAAFFNPPASSTQSMDFTSGWEAMVEVVTPIPKPTINTFLHSKPAKKGKCPIILTALMAS